MISKEKHLIKELARSSQPILVICNNSVDDLLEKVKKSLGIKRELFVQFVPDEGVEELRLKILDVSSRPISGINKLFHIDQVENLNIEQSSTMLKLLEEPPAHLKIILSSNNLSSIIKTIRSRCKEYILSSSKIVYDREQTIISLLNLTMNDYLQITSKMTKSEFEQSLFGGLEELKKRMLNKDTFLLFQKIADLLKKIRSTNVNHKLLAESLYVSKKSKEYI